MYIRELMKIKVVKWGNSLGLRIPKVFATTLGIAPNSDVDVSISKGRLVVQPVPRPAYELSELLASVTKDNLHDEVDFGAPAGRESL